MATLQPIDLTCPVCGTRFESRRIVAANSLGHDTDFRPRTVDLDPQPHYVHVCPRCMFAAFELDYQLAPDTVRRFVQGEDYRPQHALLDGDLERMSGSTKYLLAALCYAHDERASSLRMADLYLRASWCARQEGLPDRERETQGQAALLFEKALAEGEVEEGQIKTVHYLVAELYRRIGRYELALAMFEEALSTPDDDESREPIDVLIRRQRLAALAHDPQNMTIEEE